MGVHHDISLNIKIKIFHHPFTSALTLLKQHYQTSVSKTDIPSFDNPICILHIFYVPRTLLGRNISKLLLLLNKSILFFFEIHSIFVCAPPRQIRASLTSLSRVRRRLGLSRMRSQWRKGTSPLLIPLIVSVGKIRLITHTNYCCELTYWSGTLGNVKGFRLVEKTSTKGYYTTDYWRRFGNWPNERPENDDNCDNYRWLHLC